MITLLILLGIGAAIAAHGTVLFVPAVVVAVLAFWSNGVMANYRSDPMAATALATTTSMVAAVASIGLLIAALIIR